MDKKTNFIGYPIVIIITAILTFLISTCERSKNQEEPYPPNGSPMDMLETKEMGELYYNYDERAHHIEDSIKKIIPGFEAVRSITFNYQDLKNYFHFIEKNSVDADIRISGLRFYYGKYKNDKPGKNKGKQMLFFNPTIDTIIGGEKIALAYALERDGNNVTPVFLKDIIGIEKRKAQKSEASMLSFLSLFADHHYESQGKNGGGQQSPPPYDIH
ncbi:hypothetical protein [Aquimarina macrocephali]|uniref:hypothetical protein n=1 Tax=Aquimarina macrocephali TaxID=666563 RepID=UPI003F67E2C4